MKKLSPDLSFLSTEEEIPRRRLLTGMLMASLLFVSLQIPGISSTLLVLHTNDIHGHITPEPRTNEKGFMGGAGSLATAVKAQKRKAAMMGWDTLLVDAGDFMQGTPYSDLSRGESMAAIAKALGYEFFTLGNHEFDFGRDRISELIPMTGASFICSNLTLPERSGSDKMIPGCQSLAVVDKAGVKVGIFALMTTDLPAMTVPANIRGIEILDPVETSRRVIDLCQSRGATVIILLSHMGYGSDVHLASRVQGIDVIVGGHSHTPVINPMIVPCGASISSPEPDPSVTPGSREPSAPGTMVVQSGSYSNYLGWVNLKIDDSTGRVVEKRGGLNLVDTAKYTADASVAAIADTYIKKVDDLLGERVGVVENEMISNIPPDLISEVPPANAEERKAREKKIRSYLEGKLEFIREPVSGKAIVLETNAGNFIADAMRWSAGADVAIQNGGGVRGGLAGEVVLKDLHRMMPFKNKVVMTRMKGSMLRILAERIVARYEYGIGVISGMEISFDPSAQPMSRVRQVLVNGSELLDDRDYNVATNDFIFEGGDSYVEFRKCTKCTSIEEVEVREAMRGYLSEMSPLKAQVEGRIRTVQ